MIAAIQWQSPQLFWLTALAIVATLTAVVWLYRPQVRPLPAPWWWLLLALRTFALGVLALSILRPTLVRPEASDERGVVAVVIDQSQSMSVVDTARTPAQLVQMAAALGWVPRESRPATLDELRQRVTGLRRSADEVVRAYSEREYARLAGRGSESAEQHLQDRRQALADSLAQALSSARSSPPMQPLAQILEQIKLESPDAPDVWGREVAAHIEQVVEQIDQMQSSADEQLYRSNDEVHRIADELAALSRIQVVQRALNGGLLSRLLKDRPVRVFGFADSLVPLALPLEELSANGARTDFAAAMRELRLRLANQQVAGVVLFSDGRQTGDEASAASASIDAPVLAVEAGARQLRDLSIQRVLMPQAAFVGETVPIRVDVGGSGYDGAAVEVTAEVAGRRHVTQIPLSGDSTRAEIPVSFEQSGPVEVTLSVQSQPGEATAANNQVRRVIKMSEEKVRVGLIAGVASWDVQALRQALHRGSAFAASDWLVDSQQGPTPEQILAQDVLILSDVAVELLDAGQWDAISRLVHERGAALVLAGAEPAVSAGYAWHPYAASFLPWRGDAQPAWRVWPGEVPMFRIAPSSPEAAEVLRLSEDPELNRSRWNELPPVFRFLAMPSLKPNARVLLEDRDSGSPVLTESRAGAGRVLFLGLNEVWRWREAFTERDKNRFWMQLVRYASHEPYAVSDGDLSLDASPLRVEPQQPLRVRARTRSMLGSEFDELVDPPVLRVYQGESLVRTEVLSTPLPGYADRFESVVPGLPAGRYELRLSWAGHTLPLRIEVAANDEVELRDVSADAGNLRRMTRGAGEVLEFTDVPSLLDRLKDSAEDRQRFTEVRLWDSPYLFLLVLGCLGLEWAVRKRVGLV